MKIPFDIKFRPQIESGEYKVVTHDGRPARIICWDLDNGDYVIAAAIKGGCNNEIIRTYTDEGCYLRLDRNGTEADLFIITPEPELSNFERQIENLLNLALPEGHAGTTIKDTKRVSAELLALAKKELENDLPMWRKANRKELFNERMIVISEDNDLLCTTNCAEVGEYYLLFSDLMKLPKEDEK